MATTGHVAGPVQKAPFLLVRYRQARPALRVWIACLVVGAAAVALRAPALPPSEAVVLGCLLLMAVFEVEVGRQVEGGKVVVQRAHKGLSAWPFAAVLLCGSTLAVAIVVPTYAYARWRGLKVPLFKWVGSAALLALAAAAAQPLAPVMDEPGSLDVLRVGLAGVVFLAVEALAFLGCTLTGDPEDERWLKGQLRSPGFYGNEVFVLCQAVVIAVLWTEQPVLVLVLLPSYVVLHRALLHGELRHAATTDAKTGLLLLHAWEERARAVLAKGVPFSVVLVDLDHFKRVNDEHGHLVGDEVLAGTAELLRGVLRPHDVLGRFGGEEFVVLLPDADAGEATAVAERLRAVLEGSPVCGLSLTGSFGIYASEAVDPSRLREALACADLALYAAKRQGRNVVRTYRPALEVPVQRSRPVEAVL